MKFLPKLLGEMHIEKGGPFVRAPGCVMKKEIQYIQNLRNSIYYLG